MPLHLCRLPLYLRSWRATAKSAQLRHRTINEVHAREDTELLSYLYCANVSGGCFTPQVPDGTYGLKLLAFDVACVEMRVGDTYGVEAMSDLSM